MMADHNRDEDCTVNPDTDECYECGVYHGDPCASCGGQGYHRSACEFMANAYNEGLRRAWGLE